MDGRLIGAGVIGIIAGFIAGMCQPEEYKPGFAKRVRDDIKERMEKKREEEGTEGESKEGEEAEKEEEPEYTGSIVGS